MSAGRDASDEASILSRLETLAAGEAHRLGEEAHVAADPQRLADGWERRFVAEGARAEEMMDLYRRLGFEVAADPVIASDMHGDCADCQLLARFQFRTLYTRRPRPA
jgi:hypothetical protein